MTASSSRGAVFALPQVVLQRVGETAAGIRLLLLHLLKSCLVGTRRFLSQAERDVKGIPEPEATGLLLLNGLNGLLHTSQLGLGPQ